MKNFYIDFKVYMILSMFQKHIVSKWDHTIPFSIHQTCAFIYWIISSSMKAFNLHIFRPNVVCKCLNFWDFSNGKYIYLSKHVKVFLKYSANGLQYIVVSFTIHVSQNCFAYLTFVQWYTFSCRNSIILLSSEISYQKS